MYSRIVGKFHVDSSKQEGREGPETGRHLPPSVRSAGEGTRLYLSAPLVQISLLKLKQSPCLARIPPNKPHVQILSMKKVVKSQLNETPFHKNGHYGKFAGMHLLK